MYTHIKLKVLIKSAVLRSQRGTAISSFVLDALLLLLLLLHMPSMFLLWLGR